ncbi:unnamed protein product, partial [Microthlaspi erraticum]
NLLTFTNSIIFIFKQKKRREGLQATQQPQFAPSADSAASTVDKKLESLPSMIGGVWSKERNLQLEATTQFRKLLSIERSPPIEEVIEAGVGPRFVEFLMREDYPQLQVWCIHHVSVTFVYNRLGCWFLRVMMSLSRHPSPSVLIPALRSIGNIFTGDDAQTQKKRREGLQATQQPQFAPSADSAASTVDKKLESLPSMIGGVWSKERNLQLEATTQFRKLLSIERSPPIEEVIEAGVVPRFVEFLMREDYPQLQVWCIHHVSVTFVYNRLGCWFLRVMTSLSSLNLFMWKAVWALGNVAGDSPRCRDLVLSQGALLPLLSQLNEHAKLSMLRNATWTLSNFCRGKPQPTFDQVCLSFLPEFVLMIKEDYVISLISQELVSPGLPALERLIHSTNEEVLTDACWALSYLSDGTNDILRPVLFLDLWSFSMNLLTFTNSIIFIFKQKKRREGLQATQQPQFAPSADSAASTVDKKLESLPSMIGGVWSKERNLQLEATTQFRKLLSIERSPPIEEVIEAGVVPRFVEFLMREDYPQLQVWCIHHVSVTFVYNRLGCWFLRVMMSLSSLNLFMWKAVWALGNVAGDSPRCRDLVLSQGALLPLLSQLNEHAKLSMLRNATWTLSNFCRGKPQPTFDQVCLSFLPEFVLMIKEDYVISLISQELVSPGLPALERLIHSTNEEVLTDACWALSYLSDGTNDKIQYVIEAGVVPRLVELLQHPSPSVLIPALRSIGNIFTGDDAQTQKKRREGLQATQQPQFAPSADSAASTVDKKLESLPSMIGGVWSKERNLQLEATTQFRKLLSIERSPPIEEVIEAGVVPRFVEFLMREDYPQLQVWCIHHVSVTFVYNRLGCWFLRVMTSLSRGKPQPTFDQVCLSFLPEFVLMIKEDYVISLISQELVSPGLPALERLIHSTNEEVLTDACWALSYLSDGTNDKIQYVIEAGVVPRLVELLQHPSPSVLIPALRSIGNIFTGDDAQTQKKRREGLQATQQPQFAPSADSAASTVDKKLESLPSMIGGVWSKERNLQLEATTQFRKLLSIERSPPIEEVIEAGVVPRFVEFLMREDYPQLQAVWALGNVAGDSPRCRDLVLSQGALLPLLSQLNEHAKLSMLRNATWTLSNFCRGKPQPTFDQVCLSFLPEFVLMIKEDYVISLISQELVSPGLPALERLIHSTNEEVLTDACWALSYLSDGTNDKIQYVIEAGVVPRLVELLQHPSPSVLIPALRSIGNIFTGDDAQTQMNKCSGTLFRSEIYIAPIVLVAAILTCVVRKLRDNHHAGWLYY